MAGLAGQKVRVSDTGYTSHTAGQRLRADDVPGGLMIAGAVLLASQG